MMCYMCRHLEEFIVVSLSDAVGRHCQIGATLAEPCLEPLARLCVSVQLCTSEPTMSISRVNPDNYVIISDDCQCGMSLRIIV